MIGSYQTADKIMRCSLIALGFLGLVASSGSAPAQETATHLPAVTLGAGDSYFSVNGTPAFLFSRNITGTNQKDLNTLVGWTKSGGSRLLRLHLTVGFGTGMTSTGAVDPAWLSQWEQLFDTAAANGICVIPVFGVWADWNDGTPVDFGWHNWEKNPLNSIKGGPASHPKELLQKGSAANSLWLQWVKTLATRWNSRSNIAAWEIFSEMDQISYSTESSVAEFTAQAAAVIREADTNHRPITTSLTEGIEWPAVYNSPSLDFIEIHPYAARLDTELLTKIRQKITRYHKPVLIGECGLHPADPQDGKTVTTAPRASFGIKHAIWASIVSGSMNGRSLWWEDGYAIYSPAIGFAFLQKYTETESAAAAFVKNTSFAGFHPLAVDLSQPTNVKGGAVGSETSVIGWFRDSQCEPPDWNLRPVISGQKVTITIPGTATDWQAEYFDVATGTTLLGSEKIKRNSATITILLPNFHDAVAVKLRAVGQ